MELRRVNSIATINTGIQVKPSIPKEVYLIQGRDYDPYRRLMAEKLKPKTTLDDNVKKHLLHKGDVLMAAKGTDFFATVYQAEITPAVVSTMFLILRKINEQILPEYLAWWLNHPKTQRLLHHLAKGTSLPAISKKVLGTLELPVPPLEKQQLIVKIATLQTREKQLQERLNHLKETMLQEQLLEAVSSN